MGRRSGSRSSRSGRRAERERAERARVRGLPERQPPAARTPSAQVALGGDTGTVASDDPADRAHPRKPRAPTLVKLLIVAFVILLGVYLLGRQRDKALLGGLEIPASGSS